MALIERLMGPPFEVKERKIRVHIFFAAAIEVAFGPRTAQQMKDYFQMDVNDAAEFDTLVAQIVGNDAAKIAKIEQFHAVLMLAERQAPFYSTPTEVRTRLGI